MEMAATIRKQFGERVKALREQRGWQLDHLGERLGKSRASMSRIENGKQNLALDDIVSLAEVLNVPVPALFEERGAVLPPLTPLPAQYARIMQMLDSVRHEMASLELSVQAEGRHRTLADETTQDASARKQTTLYQKVPIFVPAMPHAYL